MRMDVHLELLREHSELFARLPSGVRQAIYLDSAVQDLHLLFHWLYEDQAPQFTTSAGMLPLMRLWVAAASIGLHQYQNAVLRIASGVIAEKDTVVDIDAVAYVYRSTPADSALRRFIIAAFVQRGSLERRIFHAKYLLPGLWTDAVNFVRMLHNVRRDNLKGVEGYNLEDICDIVYDPEAGYRYLTIRGGMELDGTKIRYPLPENVIYGENWEQMPDCFFVTPLHSFEGAQHAWRQTTQ
ncbi:hypothetical protein BCR34DRAFT_577481 [Clohesyomyces aquaticus]|uniref:BTB domain-containing protein n=1 Tax=Clohesyomyces aquaticus TaxID=1231657 RepID=A0A1Y1YJD5_9PLEO|nr:hypothetical protein BCR34DRAFT_577481 [Clohesyomyces aquaticus]